MKILDINDNYVTKEDYLMYTGINLDLELPSTDDDSNNANRFIHQCQLFVLGALNQYEPQEVNESNLEHLKIAILEQIKYALINTNNMLCNEARNWLRKGGFMNIRRG